MNEMTDEEIEKKLCFLAERTEYKSSALSAESKEELPTFFSLALSYISRLHKKIMELEADKNGLLMTLAAMIPDMEIYKQSKQLAETQLKELLSILYQGAEKPLTLERKDILKFAKDYGIAEYEIIAEAEKKKD